MSDTHPSSNDPRRLLVETMNRHSKTLVLAFLLFMPPGLQASARANDVVSQFTQSLAEQLQAKRLDPAILCQATGPQQYTCLVLINGHRSQAVAGHLAVATTLWATTLGLRHAQGLITPCTHGDGRTGLMIRKDRPDWHGDLEYCQRWVTDLFGQQAPT